MAVKSRSVAMHLKMAAISIVRFNKIVSFPFAVSAFPKCPYAWSPNTKDPNSTSCYLTTNIIKRSWPDAQTFCEQMGGSLFKIDSIAERVSIL